MKTVTALLAPALFYKPRVKKTPYQRNYLPYIRKIVYLCKRNRRAMVVVGRMHRRH